MPRTMHMMIGRNFRVRLAPVCLTGLHTLVETMVLTVPASKHAIHQFFLAGLVYRRSQIFHRGTKVAADHHAAFEVRLCCGSLQCGLACSVTACLRACLKHCCPPDDLKSCLLSLLCSVAVTCWSSLRKMSCPQMSGSTSLSSIKMWASQQEYPVCAQTFCQLPFWPASCSHHNSAMSSYARDMLCCCCRQAQHISRLGTMKRQSPPLAGLRSRACAS